MSETLLIVDTVSSQASLSQQAIQDKSHYRTITITSTVEAARFVRDDKEQRPDALLLDVPLSDGGCLELIQMTRALKPLMPIIALTKYGEPEHARQVMQAGASDFLSKPVELGRLILSLQQALKTQRMNQYITWLERKIAGHIDLGDLVGKTPLFRDALMLASEAAASKKPVWIAGAEGTGKAMFARAIHGSCDRAGKPFVAVNCQMLAGHLAESVLFGQENSGAPEPVHFTLGKVREADHGTLLLASIESLPLVLQQRMANVLNTGAVTPQGSRSSVAVNIRIICTTGIVLNNDIVPKEIEPRLYQRTQKIVIHLPRLSNRKDNIALLAEHFLAMHCASENKYIRGFAPRALEWLVGHPWPGNVHQLSNTLWQAVLFCRSDMLDIDDLQNMQKTSGYEVHDVDRPGGIKTLKSVQEEAIRFALKSTNGCMTQAARSLGIGRSTLYRKVSEFDLGNYISRANQTTRPMINVSSADRS